MCVKYLAGSGHQSLLVCLLGDKSLGVGTRDGDMRGISPAADGDVYTHTHTQSDNSNCYCFPILFTLRHRVYLIVGMSS